MLKEHDPLVAVCATQIIEQYYAVSRTALHECLAKRVDTGDTGHFASSMALFIALDLREDLLAVMLRAASSLTASMWTRLPHQFPTVACEKMLRTTVLLCACHLLVWELPSTEPEAGNQEFFSRHALLSARLAVLAISFSLECFDVVPFLLEEVLGESEVAERVWWSATWWNRLSSAVASGRRSDTIATNAGEAVSLQSEYAWSRLHMLVLAHVGAGITPRGAPPHSALSISVHERGDASSASSSGNAGVLVARWLLHARTRSRELSSRLPYDVYPLDAGAVGSGPSEKKTAVELWQRLSSASRSAAGGVRPPSISQIDTAIKNGSPVDVPEPLAAPDIVDNSSERTCSDPYPTSIWPLEDESQTGLDATNPRRRPTSLSVATPLQMFHKKGDFVRAVCVNALNRCQLAISLSKGVHQLEIVEGLPGNPTTASADPDRIAQHGRWTASPAGHSVPAEVRVHQSHGTDDTARCLCAHPKVRGRVSAVACLELWGDIPIDPMPLATTHCSLLTIYCSLPTAHYLLTVCHMLLTTHCLLLTAYYSLLTTCCLLLTSYYLLLALPLTLTTYYDCAASPLPSRRGIYCAVLAVWPDDPRPRLARPPADAIQASFWEQGHQHPHQPMWRTVRID